MAGHHAPLTTLALFLLDTRAGESQDNLLSFQSVGTTPQQRNAWMSIRSSLQATWGVARALAGQRWSLARLDAPPDALPAIAVCCQALLPSSDHVLMVLIAPADQATDALLLHTARLLRSLVATLFGSDALASAMFQPALQRGSLVPTAADAFTSLMQAIIAADNAHRALLDAVPVLAVSPDLIVPVLDQLASLESAVHASPIEATDFRALLQPVGAALWHRKHLVAHTLQHAWMQQDSDASSIPTLILSSGALHRSVDAGEFLRWHTIHLDAGRHACVVLRHAAATLVLVLTTLPGAPDALIEHPDPHVVAAMRQTLQRLSHTRCIERITAAAAAADVAPVAAAEAVVAATGSKKLLPGVVQQHGPAAVHSVCASRAAGTMHALTAVPSTAAGTCPALAAELVTPLVNAMAAADPEPAPLTRVPSVPLRSSKQRVGLGDIAPFRAHRGLGAVRSVSVSSGGTTSSAHADDHGVALLWHPAVVKVPPSEAVHRHRARLAQV